MFSNRKKKIGQLLEFQDFWKMDHRQVSASYEKLSKRIEQLTPLQLPKPAFNWWKLTTIAASVALLIICGFYRFTLTHPPVQPSAQVVYVSDRASQVVLSDGTKVWLSAHSKLQYPQVFTDKTRDVTLEGEAYFEVAHNSQQPFRVIAGDQIVVALGTSFNVRAYADEQDVKVSLVEGSVSVTDDNTGQAVILKPAQEAIIGKKAGSIRVTDKEPVHIAAIQPDAMSKKTGPIAVGDANLDLLMSWKTGRYVFNNVTFEEITKTLERGFKVTIRVENEELKNKPYTMRFENGESLETILDLIRINAKYSYKYHNGIVVIK
jgi:ferric-dicitrate binding protein FerR (iron transport regulator)